MIELTIRKAQSKDLETIAGFNIAMAKETEDKVLDKQTVMRGTQRLYEKDNYGFYIVAEHEKKVVGSLLITYEWSDWRDGVFWWVQSVYIAPEFRKKGVFRRMFEYVRDQANRDIDVCGLRLYVEEENTNAQETYRRLGMEKCSYQFYEYCF